MRDKILDRFDFEGLTYIVGTYVFNISSYRIDSPYFMVTTKTAKRRRPRKVTKKEMHFNRINIKNPLKLARKILNIYKKEFILSDFVVFSAWEDDKIKREKIYKKLLESIGFNYIKEVKNKFYLDGDHIFINNRISIKNKKLNSIIEEYQKQDVIHNDPE